MVAADFRQFVIDVLAELRLHVDFPTKLTDIGQTARHHLGIAYFKFLHCTEGEGVVGKIRAGRCFQQRAAVRSHDAEHRRAAGDVGRDAMGVIWNVALQPREVAHLTAAGGDDHVGRLTEAGDGQVRFDPAIGVEPLRVDHLANRHIYIARADTVQHGTGVTALNTEFREAGLVVESDSVAGRTAFRTDIVEPARTAIGILKDAFLSFICEEHRAFPARRLTPDGAMRVNPVMDRRAPRAARRFLLVVRPMHGIELAQHLGRAVMQVILVVLERRHPADVDVGEIHRRLTVADPVGQDLADAA